MQSHTSLFNIYDARMKAGLGSEVWGFEFLLSHRFVAVYDIVMMKMNIVIHVAY